MSYLEEIRELPWFYFGCSNSGVGHRVDSVGTFVDYEDMIRWRFSIEQFDGVLVETSDERRSGIVRSPPYVVRRVCRLYVRNKRFSAIAWWDHTVDRRPGSHVSIIASDPAQKLTAQDLYDGFTERWPVYARRFKDISIQLPGEE